MPRPRRGWLAAPAPADPYRLLFPLGALYAIAGVAPWIAYAGGVAGYPALLHRALMIQGFELCFVLGFLLTAMPAFTRGERCRVWELGAALALALGFGVALAAGWDAFAHTAFTAAVLLLAAAAFRRVRGAALAPAEEFGFVGLGLALGGLGGVLQLAAALGAWSDPAPNFGSRLVSLGMVLSLVSGVGALLVPTFAGIRDPLVIPGVAGAHQRRGRRGLYVVIGLGLAGAFALEAAGARAAGAWARAAAVTAMIAWVWKLWRRPGHATRAAWSLWASGWLTALGLVMAAAMPLHAIAALHLTFVGGYGLLTLAIATRVVVSHGRHGLEVEETLVSRPVVALLAAAVALRLAAEWTPAAGASHALGAAAACWVAAWLLWGWRMLPRVLAPAPGPGATVTPDASAARAKGPA